MTQHVMEVRLRSVQQLFNSLDPSPFVDRDLDSDAENYIVSWAREFPHKGQFRLVLHIEDFPQDPATTEERVEAAVQHYFAYRSKVAAREFTRLMREGRLSLTIGLIFLGACLLGARYLSNLSSPHPIVEFASESLIIGGWVAMWRPMEIFLYEWWPLARHRSILGRLASMEVSVRKAQ